MKTPAAHRARAIALGVSAFALLNPSGAVLAADPGDTGLAFLKIGVGARAAAMGEAYAAVAQDPTALYWNPAGIANARGLALHGTHNEWISDVRYEYVGAVHGMRGHAIGGHIAVLHMGELQGYDSNAQFTGSFRAYDLSAGVTYARRLTRALEFGLTGKFLYERIEEYTATGVAMDLGARYRTPLQGLTVAATATNLGPEMKFEQDAFLLPIAARFGAAYRTLALLEGLTVASDLRFPNDGDVRGHLGAEVWVHEMIAVRGGAKLNYDEELGTVGFGVKYREYLIDYAFVPFSDTSELGDTHRISFGWRPANGVQ